MISALVIDDSFYRAQVEHELRAKLLRLRQKAAGMLSDQDLLRRLLVGFGLHFLRAVPPRPGAHGG